MDSILFRKLTHYGFTTQEADDIAMLLAFARDVRLLVDNDEFSKEVVERIREKLSISQEFKVLRKAIVQINEKLGIENEELSEYNTFIEDCKNDNNNPE